MSIPSVCSYGPSKLEEAFKLTLNTIYLLIGISLILENKIKLGPDMDKCHKDKCQCDSWHLLKMVPGTYL